MKMVSGPLGTALSASGLAEWVNGSRGPWGASPSLRAATTADYTIVFSVGNRDAASSGWDADVLQRHTHAAHLLTLKSLLPALDALNSSPQATISQYCGAVWMTGLRAS